MKSKIIRNKSENDPDNQFVENERQRNILHSTIISVFSKIVTFSSGIIVIPISIKYFGSERYGLWITITNITSMLMLADLGISNALTTLMSYEYAKKEKELSSKYVTNSLILLSLISFIISLIFLVFRNYIPYNYVFSDNTTINSEEIRTSIIFSVAIIILSLPAALASKILAAHQETGIANAFLAAGSVLSIFSIFFTIEFFDTLPALVVSSAIAPLLANLLCLIWIGFRHKPWLFPRKQHIDREIIIKLMRPGGYFFLIQIAGMVVFNSDNIIISHFLGPAQVTPYNVTSRLVGYTAIAQTLMFPALWPAYAEAYARGDMAWIRKTFRRVIASTMLITVIACVILIALGKAIILHWAGPDAVPSESLLIAMSGWALISTIANNQSCLLAATNTVRSQAWASAAAAIVNLSCAIPLVESVGAVGVIAGTILSYLVILLPIQSWQTLKMLRSGKSEFPLKRQAKAI